MDPVDVLRRLGGIATYQEILGPCTRKQLRHAVAQGQVIHARRDRYALVDTEATRLTAARAGGVLSHLSAAAWWGWKVKHPPLRTTVTIGPHGHRPGGEVDVRWSQLADAEVHRHVSRPVRTVLDCARALPFDEALAVADSALRSGLVAPHELQVAAATLPRTGRTRALRVVEAADARAANPFESVVRAVALDVPGLRVEPQGKVPGVGRVDLLDESLGLAVEADSFEHHGTLAGLRRDVRRYTELTRRGLTVIRFLWEEAMFDQTRVHAVLVDAVAHCAAVRAALGPLDLRDSRWTGHTGGSSRSEPWTSGEVPRWAG
ncbi:hypothetical protein IEQ44_13470 [Nocardioides sp. Y6]|uniref:DUF559 domain-containing protein n=1 Tax=Nocardioides malaquae TaxID=2773426 RepID=A0ABR9RVR3_9ACTN|nr:hypothetical protein [Nocardioides malaquae]MBE7325656.1 hypothetical protein [Nocardioides malaquae]